MVRVIVAHYDHQYLEIAMRFQSFWSNHSKAAKYWVEVTQSELKDARSLLTMRTPYLRQICQCLKLKHVVGIFWVREVCFRFCVGQTSSPALYRSESSFNDGTNGCTFGCKIIWLRNRSKNGILSDTDAMMASQNHTSNNDSQNLHCIKHPLLSWSQS